MYALFLKRQGYQEMFSFVKGTLWGNCKFLLDNFKGTKAMTNDQGALQKSPLKYQAWPLVNIFFVKQKQFETNLPLQLYCLMCPCQAAVMLSSYCEYTAEETGRRSYGLPSLSYYGPRKIDSSGWQRPISTGEGRLQEISFWASFINLSPTHLKLSQTMKLSLFRQSYNLIYKTKC